jgi:PAS domain S-box-containing protein
MLKTTVIGVVAVIFGCLCDPLYFAIIVTILFSVSLRWRMQRKSAFPNKAAAMQAIQRQDPTTWQAIFQNSFDPMLAIDRFGSILASNKAVTKTFGYDASELLGQNVTMLMPPGQIRSHHHEYLATYGQTRVAHIIGVGREVQAMRKDGTLLDMELAVNEAELDGHSVYIGSLRDLSQRREDERNAAIVRARSEFVAAISHEARSVIGFLIGLGDSRFLFIDGLVLADASPFERGGIPDAAAGRHAALGRATRTGAHRAQRRRCFAAFRQ